MAPLSPAHRTPSTMCCRCSLPPYLFCWSLYPSDLLPSREPCLVFCPLYSVAGCGSSLLYSSRFASLGSKPIKCYSSSTRSGHLCDLSMFGMAWVQFPRHAERTRLAGTLTLAQVLASITLRSTDSTPTLRDYLYSTKSFLLWLVHHTRHARSSVCH